MATNEKRLAQRLGASIRRLRQARSWSQAEFAERAEVSVDYVSLLERGQRLPALGVLVQLSDVFGVSVDSLLGRELDADEWLREATGVLGSIPVKSRGVVLAMLRGAVKE